MCYTIVEDLTVHCFNTSTENLEQAMQVSGWGAVANVRTHQHMHMYIYMHAFVHTHRNAQREK